MLEIRDFGRVTAQPRDRWLPAPASLVLLGSEIHVWRASLDLLKDEVHALLRMLAPDEVERAKRFFFDQDHDRFIVARGQLRILLGRYLNLPPEELLFRYGPRGKPTLAPEFDRWIRFNLSHSHSLVVYAVTRHRPVGIDLEFVRQLPEAQHIVERFFSPQEQASFSALSPDEQLETFFRYWTRKEACLKAVGDGFALDPSQVHVSVSRGRPVASFSVSGDPGEASRWYLHDLVPGSGYTAALAVQEKNLRLSRWEWTG